MTRRAFEAGVAADWDDPAWRRGAELEELVGTATLAYPDALSPLDWALLRGVARYRRWRAAQEAGQQRDR